MIYNKSIPVLAAVLLLLLVTPITGRTGDEQQDAQIGTCEECDTVTKTSVLKGTLDAISSKASMLQLTTDSGTKVVIFNDETILLGTKTYSDIKPGTDLDIKYLQKGGVARAVSIETAAEEITLEDNQIDAKELSEIISENTIPYTLVDARPSLSYNQGFIPGAVSIYNGVFDKNTEKLPANKEQLIVYYCGGTS